MDSTCNYHKFAYTQSEWETIISEVNYLVNSRPLFLKTVENLDEEPFSENTLLYPYGQKPMPQSSTPDYVDPRVSINILNASSTRFGIHGCATCHLTFFFEVSGFKPRENLKNGDYVIVLKPGLKSQSSPRGLWEHAIS